METRCYLMTCFVNINTYTQTLNASFRKYNENVYIIDIFGVFGIVVCGYIRLYIPTDCDTAQ